MSYLLDNPSKGGAINALLVALGITKSENAEKELTRTWKAFRQQQFFQPSYRFNLVFGLCFGLLQALFITVAVLLFGRHSLNWPMTGIVLLFIGVAEVIVAIYFKVSTKTIVWVLGSEGVFIIIIILTVFFFDLVVSRLEKFQAKRKKPESDEEETAAVVQERRESLEQAGDDLQHWRWLTIILMLVFSILEGIVANSPTLESPAERLSESHWVEHIWMLLTLICNWAFPYPLAIGLFMALIGGVYWRSFDWNRRRETFVWWITIFLIVVSGFLALETFFKENSPSKVQGIEEAFAQQIPDLIRRTVKPDFPLPQTKGEERPLEKISTQIMDETAPLLQRDLVITTSKLPVRESAEGASLVNSLPDDLYFYFRNKANDEKLKPPSDPRFVPFKYNPDKLLDVVIGSSTIYPIFPSRPLTKITLGNEELRSPETIPKMNIIDGGFIHNIPIEAAGLWKASHIILIEASPLPQQSEPRDFWDNAMMAFGYLFSQAQRTDKLARGEAETFELRPTSQCEKKNIRPTCIDKDDVPEPDIDAFDFSPRLVERAFRMGENDVTNLTPLFVRVPGPPLFRTVTGSAPRLISAKR